MDKKYYRCMICIKPLLDEYYYYCCNQNKKTCRKCSIEEMCQKCGKYRLNKSLNDTYRIQAHARELQKNIISQKNCSNCNQYMHYSSETFVHKQCRKRYCIKCVFQFYDQWWRAEKKDKNKIPFLCGCVIDKLEIMDQIIKKYCRYCFKGLHSTWAILQDETILDRNCLELVNSALQSDDEKYRKKFEKIFQLIKSCAGCGETINNVTKKLAKEEAGICLCTFCFKVVSHQEEYLKSKRQREIQKEIEKKQAQEQQERQYKKNIQRENERRRLREIIQEDQRKEYQKKYPHIKFNYPEKKQIMHCNLCNRTIYDKKEIGQEEEGFIICIICYRLSVNGEQFFEKDKKKQQIYKEYDNPKMKEDPKLKEDLYKKQERQFENIPKKKSPQKKFFKEEAKQIQKKPLKQCTSCFKPLPQIDDIAFKQKDTCYCHACYPMYIQNKVPIPPAQGAVDSLLGKNLKSNFPNVYKSEIGSRKGEIAPEKKEEINVHQKKLNSAQSLQNLDSPKKDFKKNTENISQIKSSVNRNRVIEEESEKDQKESKSNKSSEVKKILQNSKLSQKKSNQKQEKTPQEQKQEEVGGMEYMDNGRYKPKKIFEEENILEGQFLKIQLPQTYKEELQCVDCTEQIEKKHAVLVDSSKDFKPESKIKSERFIYFEDLERSVDNFKIENYVVFCKRCYFLQTWSAINKSNERETSYKMRGNSVAKKQILSRSQMRSIESKNNVIDKNSDYNMKVQGLGSKGNKLTGLDVNVNLMDSINNKMLGSRLKPGSNEVDLAKTSPLAGNLSGSSWIVKCSNCHTSVIKTDFDFTTNACRKCSKRQAISDLTCKKCKTSAYLKTDFNSSRRLICSICSTIATIK